MPTNQIMFGGNILPCSVERFPDIHKAQRKFRQFNIPGRNGDIFFQSDAYENVIQSYEIYAGGEYGSQEPWTQLARMLYLDGYQELRDTYDPTHFRKAVFNGPIDIENSWNTHGRATIEFNCRPERYLIEGNNPISYPGAGALKMRSVSHSGLSSDIQSVLEGAGIGDDLYFVFDFPSEAGQYDDLFYLLNMPRPDSGVYVPVGASCPVGAEGTASSGISTVRAYKGPVKYGSELSRSDYGYFSGTSVIIPRSVTSGETPILYFYFNTAPRWRLIDTTVTLKNNYMPAYPSVVLHRKTAYSGELAACQIGAYSIWITYDADNPYYFVDTENFAAAKAATLVGERELANNVRIDAGIKLEKGENNLFTSGYFDMTLTPNWWEL